MKKYIISLDQGTTSCRSILFDQNKNIVHVEQQEFTQIMHNLGKFLLFYMNNILVLVK